MARIFVSHSHLDRKEAEDILAWLRDIGFDNAYLDIDERTGTAPGEHWEQRLYREMAACSAVILLVTPHWLASKWCFAEFVQARATGKAIFPIILTPEGAPTFASDIQRVDFVADPDAGRRMLARRLKDLALGVQSGFDWDPRRSPYPGLPSFEREDAAVYFGRDGEVLDLIERLRARAAHPDGPRIVAVLGASGSGKSSLVRAGVLPRLSKFDPAFVPLPPIRPGTDPCAELAKALAEALGQPARWDALRARLDEDVDACRALLTDVRMAAGRREASVLLVVDQAEELFGVTPDGARASFERVLRTALAAGALVLLTLRSDRLGELQAWLQPIAAFDQFSLPPLPASRLPQVIEGPARVAGVTLDTGLTDAIVHDAGGSDAMPLLAFTLRELWLRAWHGGRASGDAPTIRLPDYRALADEARGLNPLENAVRRRADEIVAARATHDDDLRALRETFVGALARIDDTGTYYRRAARWDEIDAAARDLVETFVQARLLVSRTDGDGTRVVEVAHESLLRKWPLLAGWLDDERSFLLGRLQLQRSLADWQTAPAAQRDSALLHGLMLERARAWLAERPQALSADQRTYIEASVAHAHALRQAARKRRMAIAVGATAASLIIVGLAGYLQVQRREASALALEVDVDRWIQRSGASLASGQPDRAWMQATRAHELQASPRTRSALWQASVGVAPRLRFSVPAVAADGTVPPASIGAISALTWMRDDEALAVGDRAGRLYRLGADDGHAVAELAAQRREPPSRDVPEAVLGLSRLGDGSLVAALEDGRVLKQAAGQREFAFVGQAEPIGAAAFASPEGTVAVLDAARERATLMQCDARSACAHDALRSERPTAVAADPASRRVAVASADGRIAMISIGTRGAADARFELQPLLPADSRIVALALDRGGRRVAAGLDAGLVVVLDTSDGRELARLSTSGATAQHLAWSPDGASLAGDCEAVSLCVWRAAVDDGMSLAAVLAVRGGVGAIAWSGDGRRLAAGELTGRVHVWDLASAPTRAAVLRAGRAGALTTVDAHADGRRVVAADVHGRAYVWDLPSQRLQQQLQHELAGESRAVRFHPVLPQVALATLGGGVAVLALDSGMELARSEGSIEAVTWDAARGRLVTGSQDGQVRAHELSSSGVRALAEPHADAVVALAIGIGASNDATSIYSADTRGVVKVRGGVHSGVFATAVDRERKPFSVGSLSVAPGGSSLLAAGSNGEVLVFDRASRELVARLETGADQVNAAAFSPDGRNIAAVDNAGRVHVWSGPPWQPYATLWLRHEPGRVLTDVFGQLGQLQQLAWLPDSRRVAIAAQSGVVVVLATRVEDWLPAAK